MAASKEVLPTIAISQLVAKLAEKVLPTIGMMAPMQELPTIVISKKAKQWKREKELQLEP